MNPLARRWALSLALGALGLCGCVADGGDRPASALSGTEPSALERRAERELREGKLELAERSFRRLLNEGDDPGVAREGIARVQMRRGNLALAEAVLERLVEDEPERVSALGALGVVLDRQERFDEARERYAAALEADPTSATTLSNLGYSFYLEGQLERAEAELSRAVEIDPSLTIGWSNLALVRVAAGDQEGARAALRRIGDERRALNNLGYLNLLVANEAQAREYFERSQDASPEHYPVALANLTLLDDPRRDQRLRAERDAVLVDAGAPERRDDATAAEENSDAALLGADGELAGRAVDGPASRTSIVPAVDVATIDGAIDDRVPVTGTRLTIGTAPAADAVSDRPIARPSRRLVRRVQRELARRGHYEGAIDGKLGPLTAAGLEAVRAELGLSEDGLISDALLDRLDLNR